MNPTSKILSLVAVAGAVSLWWPNVVHAQVTPAREQFLELLLRRQDQRIVDTLERQEAALDLRFSRLEARTPTTPPQTRQIARAKVQIERREQYLERQIASPPPSPLRVELTQKDRQLIQENLRIERRIEQLEQMAATRPRLRFRFARLEEGLAQEGLRVGGEIQEIERILATPIAPANAANFFGL